MYFFRQFKDHNSGREHKNYTTDTIFSSTFSALPANNIHFWIWKYLQFIFKFITSVHSGLENTSIFWQKLLIWTVHHTFPESRHPEVTKKLYYVLFTRWRKIPIFLGFSSWTILEVEENFIYSFLLFYYVFGDKKNKLLRALLTCTFIRLLLNSFDLRSYSSKSREAYTLCTFRVILFSCEGLGRGL